MKIADGRFQYILFDLDGTLTDPKVGITRCVQYALGKFGIDEPDLDKLEPFIGPPLIESLNEFYGFDEKKAAEAVVFYRERFGDVGIFENKIYGGMEELLARLKEEGRTLAIASSKPTIYVNRILQYFNIEQYFDVIVGSELDGTRSQKNEVVEEALNRLKALQQNEPEVQSESALQHGDKADENFVMIGDRKFDINAAKKFGIVSIGVSYGYAAPDELEQAGADYIVDTVEELGKLLIS
ncbi:MAG: HAD hydrolase-like protein [Butyrivibrio sp.]|nr:HAD hydrolase-like protein [Butyrivibrio sp.]